MKSSDSYKKKCVYVMVEIEQGTAVGPKMKISIFACIAILKRRLLNQGSGRTSYICNEGNHNQNGL